MKLIYWYHPPSYWDYTRHADKVNRDILRAFEKAGIHIALPPFATRISDESGSPATPPQEGSDPSR